MREIRFEEIRDTIAHLAAEACTVLPEEARALLEKGLQTEESPFGREALRQLLDNAEIASCEHIPMCQDTGMAVVFADVGQDVHIVGGSLTDAINEGVRLAYQTMRKSVTHPLTRQNTGDNTPAIIHYDIIEGDRLRLAFAPKGFGSENMSALRMLTPSAGIEGVKSAIVSAVETAGANPCPPVVVGVGIGGTMEKCALLAKRALLRPAGQHNADPELAALEIELLERINALGIGPQGLGGRVTALAVHIDLYPTHIAGLPVAVNMQCHACRHAEAEL